MKWYADDTGLLTERDTRQENVLLFGGILIDQKNEILLHEIIKSVKREYTDERMPIKWNMRDLRQVYNRNNRMSDYENLLKKSRNWREIIFQKLQTVDYRIIVSIIDNFKFRKLKKDERTTLRSYCFSNALMRVALAVRDANREERNYIVLDWPENDNPSPYTKQYYCAYHDGKNTAGQSYSSGALKDLNFNDSIFFAKMKHSLSLQFADLCIGSFKDFLDSEIRNKGNSQGRNLFHLYKGKIHGYPDIMQKGVILQKGKWGDSLWNNTIRKILDTHAIS